MDFAELMERTAAARADLPVRVRDADGQVRDLAGVEFTEETDDDGSHRVTEVVLIASSE